MQAKQYLLQVRHTSVGPWKAELFKTFGLCRAVQSERHRQTEKGTCLARPCGYGTLPSRRGELPGGTRPITTGKIKLAAGAAKTWFKLEFARMEHQPNGPLPKLPETRSTGSARCRTQTGKPGRWR